MFHDRSHPPDGAGTALADWFDRCAAGLDVAVTLLEMWGVSGLVRWARPLTWAFRLLGRLLRG